MCAVGSAQVLFFPWESTIGYNFYFTMWCAGYRFMRLLQPNGCENERLLWYKVSLQYSHDFMQSLRIQQSNGTVSVVWIYPFYVRIYRCNQKFAPGSLSAEQRFEPLSKGRGEGRDSDGAGSRCVHG
jgi:hypothetical protein